MLRRRDVGALALLALASPVCGSEADGVFQQGTGSTGSVTGTGGGSTTGAGGGTTGGTATATGTGGSGSTTTGTGGSAPVDLDLDGVDDALEAEVAATYLPYLSIDPGDGCPLGGIVYRVSPHPADPSKLLVYYDHLFQDDCGLGGHVGDNEVFAITADPAVPPPAGIVAIKAISHQGTLCERTSECGACGLPACDLAVKNGAAYPVVFSSKDKHAGYATLDACGAFQTCFDSCSLAPQGADVPMVNAGEPAAHLTENLTTDGFITAANGWTAPELLDYNPWEAGKDFGGAGAVADDLVDPAFVTATCPP